MLDQQTEEVLEDLLNFDDQFPARDRRATATQMARHGTLLQLDRDVLLQPGHYLVGGGQIAREITATDGQMRITLLFEPGDLLCLRQDTTDGAERFRVLTPCVLVQVAPGDWDQLTLQTPDFAVAVSRIMEDQMDRCARRIAGLMGEKVRTRLARYLLRLVRTKSMIVYPLRQYDIARYFGVAPETINRTFREFLDLNLMERHENGFALMDCDGLGQIACNRR